jgi:hypothetical protein
VGEHDGDVEAARALDVHEVAVGALDQALELVLAGLSLGVGVKEILAHGAVVDGGWVPLARELPAGGPRKAASQGTTFPPHGLTRMAVVDF